MAAVDRGVAAPVVASSSCSAVVMDFLLDE